MLNAHAHLWRGFVLDLLSIAHVSSYYGSIARYLLLSMLSLSYHKLKHWFFYLPFPYEQISKEGDIFPIPTEIAKLSNLVVTTLGEEEHEHDDDDEEGNAVEIPLSNVKSNVLGRVVAFCEQYKKDPSEFYLLCDLVQVDCIMICNLNSYCPNHLFQTL